MPGAAIEKKAGRRALWIALCASVVALGLAVPARAATTIVVTSTADAGANSLRQALLDANPGDTISIPTAGDYAVTSADLAVTKNVSIAGSGPAVRLVADANNRVFNVTAASATISDLTITGGGQSGPEAAGGGIANGTGTLVLRNVTVSGNSVTSATGGIPAGAGAFNGSGSLQIVDSTIDGNTASTTNNSGGVPEGGGVANATGTLTITRTTISDNTESAASGGVPQGAGIRSGGGRLDIVDSTVEGNQARDGQVPEGGGILAEETATTITGSTVDRNAGAATHGGSFSEGGGIMQIEGSLNVVNSTITNNSVSGDVGSAGGGVDVSNATFDATNTTIASNVTAGAATVGGNLSFGTNGIPTTFKPRNTIVADGTADSGPNCAFDTGTSSGSQGHNLESGSDCGFTAPGDLAGTDPQLADLDDNGGPTQTRAPATGSPAVNAGTDGGCPAADQRGVARPQDGTCDIGAFEQTFSTDLAIAVSGQPQSVPVGVPFSMTVGVNDFGPDPGADVVAAGLVPAGARLVSATPSQGSCELAGGTCSLGAIAPSSRATVNVVLLPTRPGVLANSFHASGRHSDSNADNDSAGISVGVTPLTLTGFATGHKQFRLGTLKPLIARRRPVGTNLRFKLSAPAQVKFAFARKATGRHVRFVKAGSLTVSGRTGANTLRFQGRLSGRKKLRSGSYRVTAVAQDGFGNKSKPRRLTLRVLHA